MTQQLPIKSPCVSICALDEQDLCTGCQRSITEIREWKHASNERRGEILQASEQRARDQGLWLNAGHGKGTPI